MIRIRVKPDRYMVRKVGGPKQYFESAIHALHVVRVAIVEDGETIEPTQQTRAALTRLTMRAQFELHAAIDDVFRDAER